MKILVPNYTFDASAQSITFNDYETISLESVLLITNTTSNEMIYLFSNALLGGAVSGNVLSLTFDTTSMSDTDALQIFYEDVAMMPATNNIQLEIRELIDTMNTLVQFLYANSPRIDVANRMTVNGSEVTQPVNGTVAVSTLANMLLISGQPQQYMGQDVPLHLYDNIIIS